MGRQVLLPLPCAHALCSAQSPSLLWSQPRPRPSFPILCVCVDVTSGYVRERHGSSEGGASDHCARDAFSFSEEAGLHADPGRSGDRRRAEARRRKGEGTGVHDTLAVPGTTIGHHESHPGLTWSHCPDSCVVHFLKCPYYLRGTNNDHGSLGSQQTLP